MASNTYIKVQNKVKEGGTSGNNYNGKQKYFCQLQNIKQNHSYCHCTQYFSCFQMKARSGYFCI